MHLIEDWRKAWKFLSMWLAAGAGIAMQLYEQIPQFQDYIPANVFHHVMTGLIAFIIVGRLVKQGESNVQAPSVK